MLQESISRHPKNSSDLFKKTTRVGPGYACSSGPGKKFSFSTNNSLKKIQPNSFVHASSGLKAFQGLGVKTPKDFLQDRNQAKKPS